MPAVAAAQTASACEPRAGHPSVDVSIARSIAAAEVTNSLVDQTPEEDVRVKSGAGFTVGGEIPFASSLSVRIEGARSDLAIAREPASGATRSDAARADRLGAATLSYITAGVAHYNAIGRRLCLEEAASLGAYRVRYAERGATRPGLSGMLGLEAPLTPYVGLLFDVQVHAIFQDGQPPVTSETLIVLRLGAGVRFRF